MLVVILILLSALIKLQTNRIEIKTDPNRPVTLKVAQVKDVSLQFLARFAKYIFCKMIKDEMLGASNRRRPGQLRDNLVARRQNPSTRNNDPKNKGLVKLMILS